MFGVMRKIRVGLADLAFKVEWFRLEERPTLASSEGLVATSHFWAAISAIAFPVRGSLDESMRGSTGSKLGTTTSVFCLVC